MSPAKLHHDIIHCENQRQENAFLIQIVLKSEDCRLPMQSFPGSDDDGEHRRVLAERGTEEGQGGE
eukprot:596229-Rhodomonas_salina.2